VSREQVYRREGENPLRQALQRKRRRPEGRRAPNRHPTRHSEGIPAPLRIRPADFAEGRFPLRFPHAEHFREEKGPGRLDCRKVIAIALS